MKKKAASTGKRDILEKELKSLLQQCDEEGLIFLIRQAQIIIHNLQVDRLNQALEDTGGSAKVKKTKSRNAAVADSNTSVDIEEAADGKHFVVIINKQRKMFAIDEMRKLVKLAYAGVTNAEGGGKIYLWLKNNRQDVLLDAGIASKQHSVLDKLCGLLKKRYKVKGTSKNSRF